MYSGILSRAPFQPDESSFKFEKERNEYMRRLKENLPAAEQKENSLSESLPFYPDFKGNANPQSMAELLDLISPEDSALVALIVFLLCDNTENDVVLLGILLYILLSK